MKQIKYVLVLLAGVTTLLLAGCSKNDTAIPTENLQDLISKDTSLSIFAAALSKTKLTTFTTGPGPFTIFAPTNTAYKKININSIADLNAIEAGQLSVQTTWLIAPGLKYSGDLVGLNVAIPTQVGTANAVYGSTVGDFTFFNGRQAKKRDVRASNGIIHVMDDYLLPTIGNTTATLAIYPNTFKLWSQLVTRGGSAATTPTNRSTNTMFAPTNEALIAAGYDSTTIANTTPATLANIVRYHIIGTRYFAFALRSIPYKTDQGGSITLNLTPGSPTITGKNNTAKIIGIDITTNVGVIHTIDAVLKP
jgi:transforming growth factor-beta-induced protein